MLILLVQPLDKWKYNIHRTFVLVLVQITGVIRSILTRFSLQEGGMWSGEYDFWPWCRSDHGLTITQKCNPISGSNIDLILEEDSNFELKQDQQWSSTKLRPHYQKQGYSFKNI